jgi:VanZ family protein
MNHSPVNESFARYQLPAILWAVAIFISSSIPSDKIPDLGILHYDKVIHFLLYVSLCAFTYRAIKYQNKFQFLSKHSMLLSVLLTAGYGALDEIHQYFVPGRNSEVNDFLADTLGGLICIASIWLWPKIRTFFVRAPEA